MKLLHRSAAVFLCAAVLVTPALRGAETATARDNNVNVRGQPSFTGEIITRLKQGEAVTILDEILLLKPKAGEPAKWLKIAMPANTPVWVATMFIDESNKTVMPKRLNLRAGPGENFSVVGRLEHGVVVTPISVKEDWTEIAQPPGTYAYIAADLVNRPSVPPAAAPVSAPKAAVPPAAPVDLAAKNPTTESPAATVPVPTPKTSPTPVAPVELAAKNPVTQTPPATPVTPPVNETKNATPAPLVVAARPPTAAPPVVAPPVATPSVTERPAPARVTEISPVAPPAKSRKRIVRREGFVSETVSIQAPTPLGLDSVHTRNVIDFLQPTSTNIVLKSFKGQRVVVTGEEGIDRRWRKVPVLYVETIEAVAD